MGRYASFGEGLLGGINAAVTLDDARGRKEERARTAADYAYKNQVIGTVDDFAGSLVTDLDDDGKAQVTQILSRFLGDGGLKRSDIPTALSIVRDPTVAQQLLAIKEGALGRQLQGMPPDDTSIERQRLQQQLDAITAARGKPVLDAEKEKADIGYKQAMTEQASKKQEFKDIYQLIANDPDLSLKEKTALHREIKAKELGRDPVATAAAIEEIKERYRIAKEEREEKGKAATASEEKKEKARVAHEEAEAKVIEKAGGLDSVKPDTVESWNRSRQRLGLPLYGIEKTRGTLYGTNTKIIAPDVSEQVSTKPAEKPPSTPTIPQAAVDYLRKNPGETANFDKKYGKGASRKYLGGR